MVGTHIISEISADDHEYAVKKILMRTPAYLSIIICMALAEISLLYVALRPLADSGKIRYHALILAVIFGSFFVYAVTDTNRSFKARRKKLIAATGSDASAVDLTFEEDGITGVFAVGESKKHCKYSELKCLYIFPETVVFSGSKGNIFICRSDIPDFEAMKSFLLEKNPNIKEKHIN